MMIFLYGPPGSGKTTAGKILAESLCIPFIDLDAEMAKLEGFSPAEIIVQQGEEKFRNLETRHLQGIPKDYDQVVALGGGALLKEENEKLVREHGKVVFLNAELKTLVSRLDGDAAKRPLLKGELANSLHTLLEKRKDHYSTFTLRADAAGSPQDTAWNIQKAVGRFRLRKMASPYDAIIQEDGLASVGDMLTARNMRGPILLLSDSNVSPLYAGQVISSLEESGYSTDLLTIPAGEEHKNIETLSRIWSAALAAGLDRGSTILALGGGVVSDLAGFAAATYMRGCHWAALPTTLLSMVDASLGGKTGIDLPEGKNLAGAFYPPQFVLADPATLKTLPERELRSGLAETVKHGLIADPDLFALCERGYDAVLENPADLVRMAAAVKIQIIEEDPWEQGLRASLNLGHTIGHAVEKASGFQLLHGEAVSIGMVAEAKLAEQLGIGSRKLSARLQQTLAKLHLPINIPGSCSRQEILKAMELDKKKSSGSVRFSLPEAVGRIKIRVAVSNLELTLEEIL